MNYDRLRIKTNKKEFNIGEKISYKCHDIKKTGLFIEEVNDNEIKIVLINNRLDEGVKTIINKSLIV